MAERDYALEMWRLLDPESNLINSNELLDRIVCVKSGSRKSLFNVFQDGSCHPTMALVIDDRLKVWDEKDQPRVHIVPAFAPYYAPQAEANNTVPVLCVARNVACNVRGGFFKEFDDGLLQQIAEVAYEDDIKNVAFPPDVSSYLISEDDPSTSNGNKDLHVFDGMADTGVERRLKEAISASSTGPPPTKNLDPRIPPALQYTVPSTSFSVPPSTIQGLPVPFTNQQSSQVTSLLKSPLTQVGPAESTFHISPVTEEGEVPESELDPDTRRRLLILQHGQDMRGHTPSESQFPARPPMQVSVPAVQPRGWFPGEEEMSPGHLNQVAPHKEFPLNAESLPIDHHRVHHPPFLHKVEPSIPPGRVLENQRLSQEVLPREDLLRLNQRLPGFHSFSDEGGPRRPQPSLVNKDLDLEAGQIDPYPETSTGALQDIALKCGTKVEFNQALSPILELQFSVEVLFAGQKIGEGFGRTRREAQRQATEVSLMNLADKYLSNLEPEFSYTPGNDVSPRIPDARVENSKKSMSSIAALNEFCMKEGLGVAFQTQPQFSANPSLKNEVYAQVEINGQLMGKGIGRTWDEAKSQAAEKALGALNSVVGQFPRRRHGSPSSLQGLSNKRLKSDFSRVMQRIPSSTRYPKNASPIP